MSCSLMPCSLHGFLLHHQAPPELEAYRKAKWALSNNCKIFPFHQQSRLQRTRKDVDFFEIIITTMLHESPRHDADIFNSCYCLVKGLPSNISIAGVQPMARKLQFMLQSALGWLVSCPDQRPADQRQDQWGRQNTKSCHCANCSILYSIAVIVFVCNFNSSLWIIPGP